PRSLAEGGEEPLLFQCQVALQSRPELIAKAEQPRNIFGLPMRQLADDQVEIGDHPAQTSVLGEDARSNIARFHQTLRRVRLCKFSAARAVKRPSSAAVSTNQMRESCAFCRMPTQSLRRPRIDDG